MPRLTQRDTRKRFLSLYRFIETELTEDNWRSLTADAAGLRRFYKFPAILIGRGRGARKRLSNSPSAHFEIDDSVQGAAAYQQIHFDIDDLDGAHAVQTQFRHELSAIRRGDSSPADTTLIRRLESRFDRLKRILTTNPQFVREHVQAEALSYLTITGPAYQEKIRRKCIGTGCDRTFLVPSSSRKQTCSRACSIDASNTRRKERRDSLRPPHPVRRTVPNRYTRS